MSSATASTRTCSQTASWGWSNAGLIVDGHATLLVDTLFDLRLTEQMLAEMRPPCPSARIDTLVNTHANGDHTLWKPARRRRARIVASERTAAEMPELPPATMAALIEHAPAMAELGAFFLRCFGASSSLELSSDCPDRDL